MTDAPTAEPELGPVGQEVVFENEEVRVWDITLEPGEHQPWHRHENPYLVIALEAADNRIDAWDGGEPRLVHEPVGGVVFREPGETHMLTNDGRTRYRSRLVEFKQTGGNRHPGYGGEAAERSREQVGDGGPSAAGYREVLLQTDDLEWADKTLAGLSHKMLWRDNGSGASIALVRFAKGSGIPSQHSHASNQFMYCLRGRYRYVPTGLTLTAGSFYWNPKGSVHGPTVAEEDSILLEIYDGPHYPTQPSWYSDPEDAR